MASGVVPQKTYFLVFAALLVLTAVTTSVAFVDLGGAWNTAVALLIACCKATLVVLFFMHLRWSSGLMRLVLPSVLLWLAILICLTLADFASRGWTGTPQPW
jgi:cytochrome c oxidase subunit 4